jgi:mannose/fructose/N-acetylgalactosamine-specific phosphotransferase system component IIC
MTISFSQAILIGLIYFAANTSFLGGLSYFTAWRPLVNGLLVGLVLGDPFRGALIGALINLLYLGNLSVGGALGIGDAALAGVLGSAIGIVTKSQGLGILGGVLAASLGWQLLLIRMRGASHISRWIDAAAAQGNITHMQLLHIGVAQGWLALISVPAATLLALLLPVLFDMLRGQLPAAAIDGIALGGRLAPALGIALALKFVFQGRNIALFFAGALYAALLLPFEIIALLGVAAGVTGFFAAQGPPHENSHRTARFGWLPFWLWQFFSHSNYSYERLQGSGLGCALAPALTRLRPDEVPRQTAFFNTEVNFGALIPPALLHLAQDGATAEVIAKARATLQSVVAGFGDTLTQTTLIPACLAAGIGLLFSTTGLVAVPLYAVIAGSTMLAIAAHSYAMGRKHGAQAATLLLSDARLQSAGEWLRSWLALALGALAANSDILRLPMPTYGLPSLLRINAAGALALTLICYLLLRSGKLKAWWILTGMVVCAITFQVLSVSIP